MWDWVRGGVLVTIGLLVGLAAGFVLWGREALGRRFSRTYRDGERVLVERVIDGDTVVLRDGMHVRYQGCDTPEVYHFIRDPEPYADEASLRNRELVEGVEVELRLPARDVSALDLHGRLIAGVRLPGGGEAGTDGSGVTVGEMLVREGLARAKAYQCGEALARRLRRAEAEARAAELGIWSGGKRPAAAGPFVASRRGKFIHRPDCVYARNIAPANLLRFNTLEAALATKRPRCPTCLATGRPRRERPPAGETPRPGGATK